MPDRITFRGAALTLVGRPLRTGVFAPYFRVTSHNLKEAGLSDFTGKIKLIHSFPSLDTPVCDSQVKEFNKRAVGLSSQIVVLGISKDLPFAQKRFCDAFEIRNVSVFSDYKFSSFGINYGLLIKELNLLARAAVILDTNDVVRYIQISKELTAALDYEDILRNLKQLLITPAGIEARGAPVRCKPCEGGVLPLPRQQVEKLLTQHPGWQLPDEKKITKEFKFMDFPEAKYFLDLISLIAEEQGHHPAMSIIYNKVKVSLTTHAAGGLTENDFLMARFIDEVYPAPLTS